MSKTVTLSTPRLVGAFVVALGLLVAGLAAGLGPADAVLNGGSGGPSVTELNWDCNASGVCTCSGEADCKALRDANPDCRGWIWWNPDWTCTVPPGEPIFHPDGAVVAPNPEDDPTLPIGPGELPGAENPGGSAVTPNPDPGPGPIGPGDLPGVEDPDEPTDPNQTEPPSPPEEPPTDLPPSSDPGDVLRPGDLPGTVDPGPRSGSGSGAADGGPGLALPGAMS